jgi:hypothetical protein
MIRWLAVALLVPWLLAVRCGDLPLEERHVLYFTPGGCAGGMLRVAVSMAQDTWFTPDWISELNPPLATGDCVSWPKGVNIRIRVWCDVKVQPATRECIAPATVDQLKPDSCPWEQCWEVPPFEAGDGQCQRIFTELGEEFSPEQIAKWNQSRGGG